MKPALNGSFDSAATLIGATLLDPLQENEPVTATRLANHDSNSGNGVPSGMRAVSVHVYESAGIVGLLRHGSKVDIQAVLDRGGSGSLNTGLPNVEVISVTPVEQGPGHPGIPIITGRSKPGKSRVIGLTGSGTPLLRAS